MVSSFSPERYLNNPMGTKAGIEDKDRKATYAFGGVSFFHRFFKLFGLQKIKGTPNLPRYAPSDELHRKFDIANLYYI